MPRMKLDTPRAQAMAFISTYDRPEAGTYERHIVRLARTWLSIMRSRHSIQGIVDRIVDELGQPPPEDYGCGWHELREKFTAWAIREDWLAPPP